MSNDQQHARALILRTCDANMRSYGNFRWPRSGRVEAPDWEPTQACGHGLHGFLHGEGDGDLASWDHDAIWIAAWIDPTLAKERYRIATFYVGEDGIEAGEAYRCDENGKAVAA